MILSWLIRLFPPCLLILVFFGIHNHILSSYIKYNAKSFKEKYFKYYTDIFEGTTTNVSYVSINSEQFKPIQSFVTNEPEWAKEFKYRTLRSFFITVFILSAPENYEKRNEMRMDFYKYLKGVHKEFGGRLFEKINLGTLTFVIGDSENKSIESNVNQEIEKHGDILKLSIRDSYRNLTFKTICYFSWMDAVIEKTTINSAKNIKVKPTNLHFKDHMANQNPTHVQNKGENKVLEWIIKVDDDVNINYEQLFSVLQNEKQTMDGIHHKKPAILCSTVLSNMVGEWRNNSMTRKWFVFKYYFNYNIQQYFYACKRIQLNIYFNFF